MKSRIKQDFKFLLQKIEKTHSSKSSRKKNENENSFQNSIKNSIVSSE